MSVQNSRISVPGSQADSQCVEPDEEKIRSTMGLPVTEDKKDVQFSEFCGKVY